MESDPQHRSEAISELIILKTIYQSISCQDFRKVMVGKLQSKMKVHIFFGLYMVGKKNKMAILVHPEGFEPSTVRSEV